MLDINRAKDNQYGVVIEILDERLQVLVPFLGTKPTENIGSVSLFLSPKKNPVASHFKKSCQEDCRIWSQQSLKGEKKGS